MLQMYIWQRFYLFGGVILPTIVLSFVVGTFVEATNSIITASNIEIQNSYIGEMVFDLTT